MFIYNIGIWIFAGVVSVGSLLGGKLGLRRKGLKGIFRRMRNTIDPHTPLVWVHAASLGEFEQGRPVIEAIRERYPQYKILLTFFSPSGYEVRKDYPGADYIFYLPVDTPLNARRFVKIARPKVAIIIKYEFWLNYLRRLQKSGARILLISAIFNRDQIFFKWSGGAFRKGLRRFEHLFVQNKESQVLLESLGLHNITVTGDTRFDRVAAVAAAAPSIPAVEQFAAGSRLLVAGSTWPTDEHIVTEMVRLNPQLKFVIVPHEISDERIDRFIASSPRKAVRYTTYDPSQTDAEVMVVDTVGILSAIYRYGTYAYIGGGFGVGIHNTLEAAAFGIPVAFGPNYHRFREACELVELGAATSIEEAGELNDWIGAMETDPALYKTRCQAAGEYIARNKGATAKILEHIDMAQ